MPSAPPFHFIARAPHRTVSPCPLGTTRARRAAAVLLATVTAACAPKGGTSTRPGTDAPAWSDAAPIGPEPTKDVPQDDLEARIARLDRWLDQFDAARFAQDAGTREALWAALGGHSAGSGHAATRDALARMLDEALALEDALAAGLIEEDHARFLADAIMLLTADLEHPADAEALATRTLAYRELLELGHPRLHDNARWRLYDHARATLLRATEVPAGERMEIAVQALYTERDDVSAFILPESPHHQRPPLPSPGDLWQLVLRPRDALASDPRWAPVVASRLAGDRALEETLQATLPAVRGSTWAVPDAPAGLATPESLAPVLRVSAAEVLVDAGRPNERRFAIEDDVVPLASRIQEVLAQDGRGTLLLVVDPMTPAPALHTLFRALWRAQATTLEIAVRSAAGRIEAMPLRVARSADPRPSAAAFLGARLSVHLAGTGPRFYFDGRALPDPTSHADQTELVARLRRAFPREQAVRLTLGGDVAIPQLVELLGAVAGEAKAGLWTVAWWAGGEPPATAPSAAAAATLQRRNDLVWERPATEVDAGGQLAANDEARLSAFSRQLPSCLPELEHPIARARVELRLTFDAGRLGDIALLEPTKLPRAAVAAFRACIQAEALPLRLDARERPVQVTVRIANVP